MSFSAAKLQHWTVGDPLYQANDGYWLFYETSVHRHISDYITFRNLAMLDEAYTIETIELVGDIIDTIKIVDGAMRRMKNV